jgi:hypothetical protein
MEEQGLTQRDGSINGLQPPADESGRHSRMPMLFLKLIAPLYLLAGVIAQHVTI